MQVSDLKHIPCPKCPGRSETVGSGTPRRIFYYTDHVEVQCMRCGFREAFWKERKIS
jgi:hypothetical protein